MADIDRIGVTVGPGSFMGQRVGIAFAKGLVLGSGALTVPLTTLEALAFGHDAPAVAIDARRGQVYFQQFSTDPGLAEEPQLLSYSDAARRLEGRLAIGSGVAAATEREASGGAVPSVEALLALTETKAPALLRTLYLRAPDAKPPTKAPL